MGVLSTAPALGHCAFLLRLDARNRRLAEDVGRTIASAPTFYAALRDASRAPYRSSCMNFKTDAKSPASDIRDRDRATAQSAAQVKLCLSGAGPAGPTMRAALM
jgi:hypothetical protein